MNAFAQRCAAGAAAVAFGLVASTAALAQQQQQPDAEWQQLQEQLVNKPQQAPSGITYVTGGASYNNYDQLMKSADEYSLKLVVAAKGSGAYLADVDVAIASLPKRETVLETRTQGPLLLADLPPGRYEVTGRFDDVRPGASNTVKQTVVVPRKGLAQAVMHFDVAQ